MVIIVEHMAWNFMVSVAFGARQLPNLEPAYQLTLFSARWWHGARLNDERRQTRTDWDSDFR
jgi:hypothetical protein